MENLRLLSSSVLIAKARALVAEERKLTREILECLREIESRKLYLELGYPSLWEFTVRHLGYSEGAAHRRIAAMRLMKEIPEIAPAIETGKLSLANLAQAQKAMRDHPQSVPDKKAFVLSLANLSSRECERKILELVPAVEKKKDRERAISQEWTEVKFMADAALMEKLAKLRGLASHQGHLKSDYNAFLHFLADLALKKLDPTERPAKRSALAANDDHKVVGDLSEKENLSRKINSPPALEVKVAAPMVQVAPMKIAPKRTRYISIQTKRKIWARAGGQCEFKGQTGTHCGSRAFLQIDHVAPYALGGTSEEKNLRLLCSVHNQHAAVAAFGEAYLAQFVKK